MAILTFPNSPTDGQTVVINDSTYIYRADITAWELLFNAPPLHSVSHGVDGGDPIEISTSQVTNLDSQLIQSNQYGAAGSVLQNLPQRILPAETKMKEAVFWFDAAHGSSNEQSIENIGWGGKALNPRMGSSNSEDANDPNYLNYLGYSYIYIPGNVGNYISVADSNELDIANNIDIRVKLSLNSWESPAATQRIIGKYGAENNRSYLLNYLTNGTLQFIWYSTSVTQHIASSGSAVDALDGEEKWVRVTVLANNGSGGTDVNFYSSNDGETWTQLGSTNVVASITGFYSSTAPIEIGDISSTSSPMTGKIFNVEISNGIAGVPVLKIDTSHITSGDTTSFTSLTGQTVTINRSSTGRKTATVCSPSWSLGTDDFIEVRERWMEHLGSNFAFIPGLSGNYLAVPDSAPLDITGNMELIAQVALDDWTPATEMAVIAKASSLSSRSYKLSITTAGRLKFSWSENGSTWIEKESTVSPGVANRGTKWLRVTLDTDNGLGQNEVRFYTADDGFTWAQLGSTVVTSGTTSIYSSNSFVYLGAAESGQSNLLGKIYVGRILQGVEGTIVLNVNIPSDVATVDGNVNSFTASTGQTVTVVRTGNDLRTATITYSGYLQPNSEEIIPANYSLLDFGTSESFTLFAVVRSFATQPTDARIISKEYITESEPEYYLAWGDNGKPYGYVSDSSNTVSTDDAGSGRGSYLYGQIGVFALVVNKFTYQIIQYENGEQVHSESILNVEELSNFGVLRIGSQSYNSPLTNSADMEVVSAAVFRKALNVDEIKEISTYYLGRVA